MTKETDLELEIVRRRNDRKEDIYGKVVDDGESMKQRVDAAKNGAVRSERLRLLINGAKSKGH